ncbi:MAG: hypothetical protein Q4F00_12860 [bacterium]|nr:hypothetical protein [bacterium]
MTLSPEQQQLIQQFRDMVSGLSNEIVQFSPLQDYYDYIGFLDDHLCAYISNSSWESNLFCSLVLGLRADGRVQLEVWQGEEFFDELYLRDRMFTSVALPDLPDAVKRVSFCLNSAGGWEAIRVKLGNELDFMTESNIRISDSLIGSLFPLEEEMDLDEDSTFGYEVNPESG